MLKRFFIQGVVFATVALALYMGSFWVLSTVEHGGIPLIYRTSEAYHWKGGATFQKYEEFDETASYDVLVLGSSHAYRGYDPRIFEANGYRTFNLGTSAQSLLNSYYLAKQYVHPNNCKLLIVDVFEIPVESDGMEATSDLVQNITSNRAALDMTMALKDIRAINMYLLRMFSKNKPLLYTDDAYVGQGFSENTDSLATVVKPSVDTLLEANELQVCYMEKLFRYIKENGINAVVVNHPAPSTINAQKHAQFNRLVERLTRKYHLPYKDYTHNHSLNNHDHFFDHNHLNQAGVHIFNTRLIQELQQEKLLP